MGGSKAAAAAAGPVDRKKEGQKVLDTGSDAYGTSFGPINAVRAPVPFSYRVGNMMPRSLPMCSLPLCCRVALPSACPATRTPTRPSGTFGMQVHSKTCTLQPPRYTALNSSAPLPPSPPSPKLAGVLEVEPVLRLHRGILVVLSNPGHRRLQDVQGLLDGPPPAPSLSLSSIRALQALRNQHVQW